MKVQFLGAAGTVTGSKSLVTCNSTQFLVDCGLFQGFKNLRLKNWSLFPIDVKEIAAVVLTHAHLDHSGYIPLLVKNGFRGPIYCTEATRDLCSLLLPDSGFLQEEEAQYASRKGFSKHKKPLALYTEKDAQYCLQFFKPVPWQEKIVLSRNDFEEVSFELHPAGHLFGAASVLVRHGKKTLAFSGDLGRKSDPVTRNPAFRIKADSLVIESTYGNRSHSGHDPEAELGALIRKTYERGGTLLIPSFAVGRAQLVLYYIHQLKKKGQIPNIPVYLNSPMAQKANEIFCRHYKESKMTASEAREICDTATSVSSVEESMAINERKDPMIIIAASGMATGGRVLHHLKAFAPHPKNTILFVGFQAGGTRGHSIVNGAKEIKIHGQMWPIRAEVAEMNSMSAHADGDELVSWIHDFQSVPSQIYVNHGEPEAADFFRRRLQEEFKCRTAVPEMNETVDLDFSMEKM